MTWGLRGTFDIQLQGFISQPLGVQCDSSTSLFNHADGKAPSSLCFIAVAGTGGEALELLIRACASFVRSHSRSLVGVYVAKSTLPPSLRLLIESTL